MMTAAERTTLHRRKNKIRDKKKDGKKEDDDE